MKKLIGIVLVVAGVCGVIFNGQIGEMLGSDTFSVRSGNTSLFKLTTTSSAKARNWSYAVTGGGLVVTLLGAWMLFSGGKGSKK